MSATKEKILTSARKLFNQHGYAQVTIRMIAQDLGMSSGNLNYHFRKKEDILGTLYTQMVEVFDARVEALPETVFSFPQIREDIRSSMERMLAYRFFWTDLHHVLRQHEAIRTHFQGALKRRKAGFLYLIQQLQGMDLMEAPAYPQEYSLLADRMIDYSDTWLYLSQVHPQAQQNLDQQANALLAFFYPFLTQKGKAALQKAAPDLFT